MVCFQLWQREKKRQTLMSILIFCGNIPFSEKQSVQLEFDSFVKGQKSFLEELMKDPAKLHICKTVIRSRGLWDNRYIQKLFLKLSEIFKK